MPAFSMWGPAESGFRLARQDAIKEFAGLAQARHDMAQAQQAEAKVAESRQLQQAMSQLTTPDGKGGPGAGGSVADVIEHQAVELSRLGQPAAAGKLGADAALIRAREAQAGAAGALEAQRQVEIESAQVERAMNLYRNVTDQRSWDSANMMFGQLFPNQANPLAAMPYSPANVKLMQGALTTEAQRRKAQVDEAELAIKERNQRSLDTARKARTKILARNAEDRARRTEILAKNGGRVGKETPVGFPKKEEIAAAGRMLESKLPAPLDAEELPNAALQVAAEAKAILKAVPGIDANTALERAVASAIKSGDFTTVDVLGGLRQRSKFSGGGKTPETAVKASKDTKFQTGRYYIGANGQIGKFNGRALELYTLPQAGSAGGLDEDELDELLEE